MNQLLPASRSSMPMKSSMCTASACATATRSRAVSSRGSPSLRCPSNAALSILTLGGGLGASSFALRRLAAPAALGRRAAALDATTASPIAPAPAE
eukprot:6256983-Alexandrium_andersonii.AAC.1